jgi:hypothetical protein
LKKHHLLSKGDMPVPVPAVNILVVGDGSVYGGKLIQIVIDVPAVPRQPPPQALGFDGKSPGGQLIVDSLRLEPKIFRELPDTHHAFFKGSVVQTFSILLFDEGL